jgi:hypothetical protein
VLGRRGVGGRSFFQSALSLYKARAR